MLLEANNRSKHSFSCGPTWKLHSDWAQTFFLSLIDLRCFWLIRERVKLWHWNIFLLIFLLEIASRKSRKIHFFATSLHARLASLKIKCDRSKANNRRLKRRTLRAICFVIYDVTRNVWVNKDSIDYRGTWVQEKGKK